MIHRNVKRALVTAVIVGPILTIINQTPLLVRMLHGEPIPPIGALRIALTFIVPFCVSWISATLADRQRRPWRDDV